MKKATENLFLRGSGILKERSLSGSVGLSKVAALSAGRMRILGVECLVFRGSEVANGGE